MVEDYGDNVFKLVLYLEETFWLNIYVEGPENREKRNSTKNMLNGYIKSLKQLPWQLFESATNFCLIMASV